MFVTDIRYCIPAQYFENHVLYLYAVILSNTLAHVADVAKVTEAGIGSTMDELKRSGAFRTFAIPVSAPADLAVDISEPVQSDASSGSSSDDDDDEDADFAKAEHAHFPEKRIKRDRQRISNMGMPDPVTGVYTVTSAIS